MDLATLVKNARRALRGPDGEPLTQHDVADLAGVERSKLAKIEAGISAGATSTLWALIPVLRLDPAEALAAHAAWKPRADAPHEGTGEAA